MAFKDNLRRFREQAGFTSKQMADKLNISYNTYLNYENLSSEPRYTLLCQIARILKTSPNELLDFDPDHPDELEQAIQLMKEGGIKFADVSPEGCTSLYIDNPLLPPEIKKKLSHFATAYPNEKIIEIYHNIQAKLKRYEKESLPKIVKEAFDDDFMESFLNEGLENGFLTMEMNKNGGFSIKFTGNKNAEKHLFLSETKK